MSVVALMLLYCKCVGAQFMAWDTFARKRVDMIGRKDHGDEVVAHEFDFSIKKQVWLLYSKSCRCFGRISTWATMD